MEKGRNEKNINDILHGSSSKIDSSALKAAMKESPDALLSKLNSEDRAKVQDLLNDRAALEKILKSDAARTIMEGLMKKGK